MFQRTRRGFTLIELLIVITIIGILVAMVLTSVTYARNKAVDKRIMSDVRQLRLLAEEVYDNQAASYANWSDPAVQLDIAAQLNVLYDDLDDIHAYTPSPYYPEHVVVTRDSQAQDFCISVPLVTDQARYFCVDATGQYVETASACPDYAVGGPPLRCPAAVE